MVSTLLSKEELQAVEAAIQRVEHRSATELVVAIVGKSGDYWQVRVAIAVGWSLATALGLHFLLPFLSPVWGILAQVPVGFLVFALLGAPPILRWLVPEDRAAVAVQTRAFALFAERGLHRTSARTGLLILVSELEHRVVILGDSGIHARVGEEGWNQHVQHVIGAIREGRAAKGLLEVIGRLEVLLAEVAPVTPDDVNELPNAVLVQR